MVVSYASKTITRKYFRVIVTFYHCHVRVKLKIDDFDRNILVKGLSKI